MNVRPFWFLYLLLFFTAKGYGHDVPISDSITTLMLTGKDISIYLPQKKGETIDQIQKAVFKRSLTKIPNVGVTENDVWVKFSLTNNHQKDFYLLKVGNTTFDEVEMFEFDSNNKLTDSTLISKHLPFSARKYKDPNYIFDLYIPNHETRTYYLRIKSKFPIIIPLYLTQPQEQLVETGKEYLLSGAYVGIVIIMVVYNFFLYLSIRDKSYIFYVFYVLGAGLTQIGLKGFDFQFLWPDSPGFENISIILFASVSSIAALLFTNEFLEIKKNFYRLYIVICIFIGLFVAGIIALFFDSNLAFIIMQSATTISSIGVLIISIFIVFKRPSISSAKFFLVAWSVLIIGSLAFILKDSGALPFNMLTNYAVMIASAVEMALLSFGLANRINILKKEKDQSRLAALRIAKENSRIIKEQNVVLEIKVKERTEELIHKNEELNTTLEDLQEAQMQLVESEKMASLGQLTAGIAHEINNPINFVTGNIGPLKRDVDILFQTINVLEEMNSQNIPDEEKIKKTEAFKEEQDFDYLKVEISHLLKGINEGASRTAEIVKSLRIFSRLDEDDLKLADINEGLDSTIVIVNNLLNQIEVNKNFGKLPLVNCYPGKLNQVFLNIISNGIFAINQKFGEAEGGKLSVETSLSGEDVIIKISDNGTGMSEQTKHKMFEPFFTTKDVGQGTGLGMSIAFNTVQKHNGSMQVDTKMGEGTTFTLVIPINELK
jgi:signal transduction histidine kinase